MKNVFMKIFTILVTMSVMISVTTVAMAEASISVSDVSVGLKTSFTLELESTDEVSGVVFVAKYTDGTSQLVGVEKYDAAAQREIETDTKNGETVKVMWWDGISDIAPFTDSVVVNDVEGTPDVSAFLQTINRWTSASSTRQSVQVNYQSMTELNCDF